MLDDGRIGVRAGGRAEQVERVGHIGRPVPQGVVDRVLQRPGPAFDRHDLGAAEPHLVDVDALALDVRDAHEDLRLHAQQRADHRGGQAVLARPGLRDELGLAHVLGEQSLAEAVVDLVGAAVQQVLALEVDLKAHVLAESLGMVERARPAGVVGQQLRQLRDERLVLVEAVRRPPPIPPAPESAPPARSSRRTHQICHMFHFCS